MTDRIRTLTVYLDDDYRTDDAEVFVSTLIKNGNSITENIISDSNVRTENSKLWKKFYQLLSYSGLRYRNRDKYNNLFLSENYLNSYKSRVKTLLYKERM